MLRRPNRASWNEESAGRPSPLAQLLASPQPLRSFHADNSFVGHRQNLPGQIGFGPTHQHPVEGTAFTGGRVSNPQSGLVHGPSMPTLSQANQANSRAGSGVAASLAALGMLAGTPHGGDATPTLAPGPGTQPTPATGAIAPSVRPAQPTLTTQLTAAPLMSGDVPRNYTGAVDTSNQSQAWHDAQTERDRALQTHIQSGASLPQLVQIALSGMTGLRYNPANPGTYFE